MKIRSLRILVCLMLAGGSVASAQAQVYQTTQPLSATKTYNPYTATYSTTPINATTADYTGAVNPYANTKFVSTSATPNSYTISVSALDIASVGEAQAPSYTPGIMKAPPKPGDVIGSDDGIGDQIGSITPVGDGIWVLLFCIAMLTALRTWQLRRTKKA